MKATAAVIHEPNGQFSFETVELDDLRGDEILVRIEASGICHTDMNIEHSTSNFEVRMGIDIIAFRALLANSARSRRSNAGSKYLDQLHCFTQERIDFSRILYQRHSLHEAERSLRFTKLLETDSHLMHKIVG